MSLLLATMILAAVPDAQKTDEPPPPLVRLSAEVDPLDYTLYRGWGLFIAMRHAALPQWRFRVGGGSASLPSAVVDSVPANKGWGFRLEPVATLTAHYTFFKGGRGGLFAGPVLSYARLVFTSPDGGSVAADTTSAGADFGYRWYPFEKLGLVITPHLGLLVPLTLSQPPTVGDKSYTVSAVIPQPAVLIGWEFDLGTYVQD
jgi:hypothetical protein